MELDWQSASYQQLSTEVLFEILRLRQAIFIIEQECPYPDIDDADKQAIHLCAWNAGTLAAYARVLAPGVSYTQASIGRIATNKKYRGTGLGKQLMTSAINLTARKFPDHAIKIGAQQHLEPFYKSFGFHTVSEPYDEDGILHIHMLREVQKN